MVSQQNKYGAAIFDAGLDRALVICRGSEVKANQRCLNLNPAVEVVVGVRFSVH